MSWTRVKDTIITGGENVHPAEVESVLAGHPAIAEMAGAGAPDAPWGETVVAVTARQPQQALEPEALRAFASEKLACYKMPRRLVLVPALSRNPTKKILKVQSREALRGRAGTVSGRKTRESLSDRAPEKEQ